MIKNKIYKTNKEKQQLTRWKHKSKSINLKIKKNEINEKIIANKGGREVGEIKEGVGGQDGRRNEGTEIRAEGQEDWELHINDVTSWGRSDAVTGGGCRPPGPPRISAFGDSHFIVKK